MDETTKVLIGTISGFIISFFAEPVKNYFQHRTKSHDLKIALYKEIIHNFTKIGNLELDKPITEDYFQSAKYLWQHGIRIECYKNALQNELSLFYELDEAWVISELQGSIGGVLVDLCSDSVGRETPGNIIVENFVGMAKLYRDYCAYHFFNGDLNGKVLKGLAKAGEYEEIMKLGKEVIPYNTMSSN